MTYREILQLYKEGKLDETQTEMVEQDLEKYEAISEYLMEDDNLANLEETLLGGEETEEAEFVESVNQSIQKSFWKMGTKILAVTLAAVLFLQFALPKIVGLFYYNPGKSIGENQNQMGLDMAVYTELFLPCRKRDNVTVEDKGYGRYDICVHQNLSYNGRFTDVSGEIIRGKLKYYDNNVLKKPVSNLFAWYQAMGDLSKPLTETMDEDFDMSAGGKRSEMAERLEKLDENKTYIGYVSLNQMMDYESFIKYMDENEIGNPWCAVKTHEIEGDTFRASNLGFQIGWGTEGLEWDDERYPDLLLGNFKASFEVGSPEEEAYNKARQREEEGLKREGFVQTHFVSLLTYLADQKQFLEMNEGEEADTRKQQLLAATDYVKENGVTIYAFAAVMDKETALKLSTHKEIYSLYLEEIR